MLQKMKVKKPTTLGMEGKRKTPTTLGMKGKRKTQTTLGMVGKRKTPTIPTMAEKMSTSPGRKTPIILVMRTKTTNLLVLAERLNLLIPLADRVVKVYLADNHRVGKACLLVDKGYLADSHRADSLLLDKVCLLVDNHPSSPSYQQAQGLRNDLGHPLHLAKRRPFSPCMCPIL